MSRADRIGFIGAGKVATVLARGLEAHGYAVRAVYSRTRASAERLASSLPNGVTVCEQAQAVADGCDLLFIATPDDAIAETSAAVRWYPRHSVVHCSGALSVEALGPVTKAGGAVGGFHPMQTFAGPDGNSLEGVTIALEGDGTLLARLKEIASALGGGWILVPPEQKPLYHLSGVLVSNYVVTLVKAATELWDEMGVPEPQARGALLALLAGTLKNMERLGVPGSLTGPIARGDLATVQRHLNELSAKSPGLLDAYRTLGLLTVPIARAKGSIDGDAAQLLRRTLEEESTRRDGERRLAPQEV